MRNALLLIMISLLGFDSVACARVVQKRDFSITIPDDWVEVPQSVLDKAEKDLKKRAPSAKVPHYDYAFQRATAKTWLTYPYLLIQLGSEPVPESELKSIAHIDAKELAQSAAKDLKPILSAAKLGKMEYDQTENVIWMTGQFDVPNIGKVLWLSGTIPHQRGTLTIHGYASERSFSKYGPIFRQAVKTAKISTNFGSEPSWMDSVPLIGKLNWNNMGTGALIGAAIGAIAALFAGIRSLRQDLS